MARMRSIIGRDVPVADYTSSQQRRNARLIRKIVCRRATSRMIRRPLLAASARPSPRRARVVEPPIFMKFLYCGLRFLLENI